MASGQIRDIFEAYVESHDPAYFADNAVLIVVPLHREFRGQPSIRTFLDLLYHEGFSYAWADLRHVAVDVERGVGVAEFTFKGRHTGDLLGIPPTTRTVEIAMLEVAEFREGRIHQARLYYDTIEFLRQLGATPPGVQGD